ncbi:MAG TPA: LPS assembly protein LptD, partial [Sedimentisphaerales bacterium]|nr:LPS assembly protein LptD [Sedimentisphaerales bacterium]
SWVGEDLYLKGREVISHRQGPSEHTLVFYDVFSMSIGANEFFSDGAVVWLKRERAGIQKVNVYLEGNISVKKGKGARTVDLSETIIEKEKSMVVRFEVRGEVFVTAGKREVADARGLELYAKALAAVESIERKLEAGVPEPKLPKEIIQPERPPEVGAVREPPVQAVKPEEKEPRFRYPVDIGPVGEAVLKIESTQTAEGENIATIMGRFSLEQKQDEEGGSLGLQADNAVIWYIKGAAARGPGGESKDVIGENVRAIYLSGDVVMTSKRRTIRAEEIYYDFEEKKALAINAVMKNFDVSRGIPIYVRAAELRQLAENKFAAEEMTMTSSEFYLPQVSFNASSVIITDTTGVDERAGKVSDSSYDAQMRDVRFKVGKRTVFYWPFVRSNLQRPDIALKSARVGHDNTWGTSIETRWYLSRLLGLREPEGTKSTLAFDYFDKRGIGIGAEIDYEREDHFGRLLGYVINDMGEDRLGRHRTRRDLEPPRELRGRFLWQHRHFLPHNWQLTSEVSYASDENFIEGFYRSEFNVGKEQETLVHLKRIEDNWGLSFLGKARINDFRDKLEELPSAEFHWTGQSLFDDKLTLYSDSQVSRFRQRLASDSTSLLSEKFFTFMSERAELDMPMMWDFAKVVPFVAGTVAYEDGSGFYSDIDARAAGREDTVWIGEAGARVFPRPLWKVYPGVDSRLWDLKGLRHVIEPHVTAVGYTESDSAAEQRDILSVGISQRLQTKRGPADNQRTTDWMRLDMDITWVNNSDDASAGADRFIWNKPFVPLVNTFSTVLYPLDRLDRYDRRSGGIFGPRRNYFSADYIWRVSDTTAILSDMNFDMQSGVVQQLNVGFSRLRWPNLSYYIGSRYLKRIDNNYGEEGSNAFIFAASYVLDPRYTVIFSQEYDFDYGANVRSDITLIRRYHRVYWGLTFRVDESMDQSSVVFSIWPEGVPEMGIGNSRYMGMGGPMRY